jgi:hypothetical protein
MQRVTHIKISNDSIINNSKKFMNQAFITPFPNMEHTYVTTKEIENIIKSLKSKNTSGYDGISTTVLKSCCSFISSPLTYICNTSLSTGVFPDRLKYAVIKLLYIGGSRKDINNYRPISVLTSFQKFLRR